MVDVVSENELHAARSFLTKFLRSSMRKDPDSRPRSWHASKRTESQPEHAASEGGRDQQPVASSSLDAMQRLEQPAPALQSGRVSPTEAVGGAARSDSGFSAENIFFKGPQAEGPQLRFVQPAAASGGWEGSRAAGRPSGGPVWQVPEKKAFPSPEGLSNNENVFRAAQESRRSFNTTPSFSLSSSDVRHSHHTQLPAHQRQHSDESPLYLHTRAPPTTIQSVGSYYRSLQDLPTNAAGRRNQENHGRYHRGDAHKPHRVTSSEPSSLKTKYLLSSGSAEHPGPEDAAHRHAQSQQSSKAPRQPEAWLPQDDHRITALKTPLLHSLAQDSLQSVPSPQDAAAASSLKSNRRSDTRYATTLRNEIQQKRAQLQKSRSAATLTCEAEDEEDWTSTETSNSSGVSSYKDHLKEAQARVLQATSFQRRDLEPPLKTTNGRIRGRKRLPLAKRTHSFSEPDKMDKVGVDERRKIFEAKPTFSRPVMKSGQAETSRDRDRDKDRDRDTERLGTFAEYQATWDRQKRNQGRYQSAGNILDADEEKVCVHERSRSSPSADVSQNAAAPWGEPESRRRGKADVRHPDCGPSHASHSSAGCQGLLPPPRLHFGPQTTSCSQEFLAGAQADRGSGCGLAAQRRAAARSSRDMSGGGGGEEERPRSPSPQFSPLRLTDRPPAVFLQDDSAALRTEKDMKLPAEVDVNSPVRKVPVKIVLPQSSLDLGGQTYPSQGSESSPVHVPSQSMTERPASTHQDPQDPGQASASVPESSSEEDAKREELARDIMGKDKSLVDILDQSGRRTTMDLMEGLFPTEEQILEGVQQRRRPAPSSPRSVDRREEDDSSAAASLVPSSSYYNTSAPKAELLIKMKDMQEQLDEQDSEDELDVDLAGKKQELICSLARKLEVLRDARRSLQDDVEDNDALGRQVESTVRRRCQANQLDKFCMFVGDLDKVVSLLLSLSGRLARVENALNSLEDEAPPEEKRTLTEKRKLLMQQHEDAKELKENLDRRERLVSGVMEAYLDAGSLDDYRHFVKMKSALIIEQRKLEDKIKLGEEQLKCLVDSLPPP